MISTQFLTSQIVIKDSISITPKIKNEEKKLEEYQEVPLRYRIQINGNCSSWNDLHLYPAQLSISFGEYSYTGTLGACSGGWGSEWNSLYGNVVSLTGTEKPTISISGVSVVVDGDYPGGSLFSYAIRGNGSIIGGVTYTLIPYPDPPHVDIIVSSNDPNVPDGNSEFEISPSNLPTISFSEEHYVDLRNGAYPAPTASTIAWNGPETINTADFYDPVTNTFVIPSNATSYARFVENTDEKVLEISVSVTVENEYGSGDCDAKIFLVCKNTILLGETKYYKVISSEGNTIKIVESSPTLGSGLANVTWSVEAYQNTEEESYFGKRLGVYWETEKPILGDVNNPLPAGLIRFVGRYWHVDSTYLVTLTANVPGKEPATALVFVNKPAKLGDTHNGTIKDVFGNQIPINDFILKCAGEYGIPPQIIKGQIKKETDFRPIYRYEPWEDIKYRKKSNNKYFGQGINFVVSVTDMGNGPSIPSSETHKYVPPIDDYIRNPIKIRNYISDNRFEYITRKSLSFFNDATISKTWRNYFNVVKKGKPKLTKEQIENYSLQLTMDDLLGSKIGKKEYDWYAQTRIMASYGFLQITHYNATDLSLFGFSKISSIQPPEYLNDQEYNFPSYGERMVLKLNSVIGETLPAFSWTDGYEKIWLKVLKTYNPGETEYENNVIVNSQSYLPKIGE